MSDKSAQAGGKAAACALLRYQQLLLLFGVI
jgi:hypothetical protein